MNPITREQARSCNERFFFTGIPCKSGHVAQRNVSDGKCYDCLKISWEKTRRKQGKKPFEPNAARREALKSGASTFVGKPCKHGHGNIRWAHNCACKVCTEIAAKSHPNRADYSKRFRERHPEHNSRLIRSAKAKARSAKVGANGAYKSSDIVALLEAQHESCAYCRSKFDDVGYHVDHMTPLSRGGSNWPSNLQLLCPSCNMRKGAKTHTEFTTGETWVDGAASGGRP